MSDIYVVGNWVKWNVGNLVLLMIGVYILKNLYLETPLDWYEHMHIKINLHPKTFHGAIGSSPKS